MINITQHAFVARYSYTTGTAKVSRFNPENYPWSGTFHIFPYWSNLSWRSYNDIGYATYPFTSVPRHVAYLRNTSTSPLPDFYGLVVY